MGQGRRAPWHDYRRRGFVMVTLATEPRRPLFGRITAQGVELSAAGRVAQRFWRAIPEHHPAVATSTLCVMPDHLHGILEIREELARPLGQVVRGYKAAVTAELRRLLNEPTLPVWEAGWHDLVALEPERLRAYHNYILDNPRRLWLKQCNPDLFTSRTALKHARLPPGIAWSGYGNPFLLDLPELLAARVSRSVSAVGMAEWRERCAALFARGGALCSPFISPGEKALVGEALAHQRGRVILMASRPLPPQYKPPGGYFDLCAAGRLLILNPLGTDASGRREPITRELCEWLNGLCAAVAG